MFLIRSTLLAFLLFGPQGHSLNLDGVVAVVGEKPILKSDVSSFQSDLKASPALAGIYQIRPDEISFHKALDKMIEEKIIQISAQDLDVKVSDNEVDTQVSTIAKQNNMTRAQLEASLKREGISLERYRRNIRSQLERRNVFDRELRRGGATASESELRNLYDKNASEEYRISMASFKIPKNPKDRSGIEQKIKDISKQLANRSVSTDVARKNLEAESLDWISSDTLNPKISAAIKKTNPPAALGPFKIDGQWTIVLYEETRRGSEDGFLKARDELTQRLQGQEFERRFQAWIEKKKQEMQIVINQEAGPKK